MKLVRSMIRRVSREESGATLIEFAMVAPIFLFLLMGSFDIGFKIFMQATLEGAVHKAARSSSLQGASEAANRAAVDQKVTSIVQDILPSANLTFERKNYASYNDVEVAERYTDNNGNGTCDNHEPYFDANGNSQWDEDMGRDGLGGARDAVLYTATLSYRSIFPFGSYDRNATAGQGSKQVDASFKLPKLNQDIVLNARTVLKNQPYGNQSTRTTTARNCTS